MGFTLAEDRSGNLEAAATDRSLAMMPRWRFFFRDDCSLRSHHQRSLSQEYNSFVAPRSGGHEGNEPDPLPNTAGTPDPQNSRFIDLSRTPLQDEAERDSGIVPSDCFSYSQTRELSLARF